MTARLFLLAAFASLGIASPAQEIFPPQWDNATNYLGGGLVRGSDGNYYRALHNSLNANPVQDDHTNWELYYVRANTVLKVAASGARFASIRRALAMVQSAVVAPPVTAQISINTATSVYAETFSTELNLNAESGARISIQGDDPTKITLSFPGGTNGITLSGGNTFGGVSNVTITGSGANSSSNGVFVDGASTLLQSKVAVTNFGNGFAVGNSSKAFLNESSATSCNFGGVNASSHAYVQCKNFTVDGKGISQTGFFADTASTMDVRGATASNLQSTGFEAIGGSEMTARNAHATGCKTGFLSAEFSTVDATGSSSKNNVIVGYAVKSGGRLVAVNITASGNMSNFSVNVNTLQADQSFIAN